MIKSVNISLAFIKFILYLYNNFNFYKLICKIFVYNILIYNI